MFHLAHPWLLAPLVPLALWVVAAEARADGTVGRRMLRTASRLLILFLIGLALAGPTLEGPADIAQRRLVVARDATLGERGEAEATAALDQASEAARAEGVPFSTTRFEAGAAAGLSDALLAFRPGELGTVWLLASGHGDLSDLPRVADAAHRTGIRVRARALPTVTPPDATPPTRIAALDLPRRVRGPFALGVTVETESAAAVQVLVEGQVLAERRIDGDAQVRFDDLELEPGLHEIAVRVASTGDRNAAPPALDRRLLHVEAPPAVWIASRLGPSALPRRALQLQGFRVRDVAPAMLARELAAGDAGRRPDLLLTDAATVQALGPEAQARLTVAVEGGLGLVLLAGEDEEAWARLAASPLEAALPLEPLAPEPEPEPEPEPPPPTRPEPPIEKPEEDDRPGLTTERRPEEALPISMLLVLDRSGSMEGPKLELAIEGAKRSAAMLSRHDRIGVITFADDATLDIPMTRASSANLGWRLTALRAAGNTDIYGALVKASRVLQKEKAPIRHLLLLTDGHQTGRDAIFGHLVRTLGEAGITLTAVGLGPSHDGVLLKNIAMWAPRGHYRPADTAAQLPAILLRDTTDVVERRRDEAEALGLLPDPRPEEPTPERPEPEPSQPEPADPVEPETPEPPTPPVALASLVLVRPHEATAGLEALPSVSAPYRSRGRRGAAVLLRRGEAEIVLAASRYGLGRVLVWTLPEDAEGLEGWAERGRLVVQAARSVRAPEGVGRPVFASVVSGPGGPSLELDADPDASAVRVLWSSGDRKEDLGLRAPGGGEPFRLPAAPPGEAALVRLLDPAGRLVAPPLTYLGPSPKPVREPAGRRAALEAALGPSALDENTSWLEAPETSRTHRGIHAWFALLALILLPFDVGLHRRSRRAR